MTTNRTIRADKISGLFARKNYFSNDYADHGGFNTNDTNSGWSRYKNTTNPTGVKPDTGTGGSPSYVSYDPAGTYRLRLNNTIALEKSANNAVGEGIAYTFNIDKADKTNVLEVSFKIMTGTGTFAAGSDTTDSDLTVWAVGVTTGEVIQLTPWRIMGISSTLPTNYSGTFQANATDNSYRICFHVSTTSATAYLVAIDDLFIGPTIRAQGPIVTDWESYTVTISNGTGGITNNTNNAKVKRLGDEGEFSGSIKFSNTSAAFSGIYISLPAGLSVDTSKLSYQQTSDPFIVIGQCSFIDTANAAYNGDVVYRPAVNQIQLRISDIATHTGDVPINYNSVSNTFPFTFNNGDEINWIFKLPISGWSSNAVLSTDYGNRTIAASAYRSGSQTGINPNGSSVKININAKSLSVASGYDTTNSFDTTTNFRYDVPETGFYRVTGRIGLAATNVLNNFYVAQLNVSGSLAANGPSCYTAASSGCAPMVSTDLYLTAGQYVELYLYGNGNNSASTLTALGGQDVTYLTVSKMANPQTIYQNETVVVAASRITSAQTITSGTETTIVFNNKKIDTHGAYNTSTGVFTAPFAGIYTITSNVRIVMGATAASAVSTYFMVDSDTTSLYGRYSSDDFVSSGSYTINPTSKIKLNAGQTIQFRLTPNSQNINVQFGSSINSDVSSIFIEKS